MRPTRLELKGFSSFRQATVVDFTGADLFALSGPTGAGKSSLIDAMTFALFGSVARYGARLVEPVISQGDVEARVLLDFSVDGAPYRVARVARRTATGATTKEARLERLPRVAGGDPIDLALGAKEVTAAVESLLGLTFEHFCRTVVLPQGAFQDFLHATGKERQDLLIELLDVGIYQDVRKRARQRADEAKAQVAALTEQLESVAGVSDEAIATVEARLLVLEDLSTEVAAAQPDLEAIRERGAALRAEHTRAQDDLARLDGIEPPEGLADLAQRLQQADLALVAARTESEAAATARERAQDATAGLPTARDLATVLEALGQVPTLAQAVEASASNHEALQAEAVAAHKAAEEAAADATSAQDALRAAEVAQGVHALRPHLVAGEPCPLCEQHVGVVPQVAAPEDLVAARSSLQAAEARARTSLEAAGKAEVAAARAGEQVAAAQQRLATHRDGLARLRAAASLPDEADDAQVLAAQRAAAEREAALDALHKAERQARAAAAQAEAQVSSLAGERSAAMVAVREAHARIADLGAPAPGDDLAASWAALAAWVDDERPRRSTAVAEAAGRVAQAVDAWSARQQLVLDAVAAAGVAIPAAMDAATAVATARAEAAAQASTLRARQAQAVELASRVDLLRERANVASSLGQILQANRFQQWLIARALTRLVVGASGILGDLSHGAYSLTLGPDNAFLVADHRNAGEERHARSLSGGETFLASLALALSLAEHVADLAAKGSARLESLFLDEGFGSLDADTLDVVATCIEELGATGRMVGLITHVPDLAQRVPVRFEVARTPEGSQVTRVDT